MCPLEQCPPLNSFPFFEKALYIKKEFYSNFCTFEIVSLVNIPGYYLRKYGIRSYRKLDSYKKSTFKKKFDLSILFHLYWISDKLDYLKKPS